MASRDGGRRKRPFGRILWVTSRESRSSATMASSRHFGEASAGTRASGGFSEFAALASNDDLVLTDKAASLTGDALQRGGQRIDILARIVKREGGAHAALKAKAAKDRLRAMM